jgi:hypothetical protein
VVRIIERCDSILERSACERRRAQFWQAVLGHWCRGYGWNEVMHGRGYFKRVRQAPSSWCPESAGRDWRSKSRPNAIDHWRHRRWAISPKQDRMLDDGLVCCPGSCQYGRCWQAVPRVFHARPNELSRTFLTMNLCWARSSIFSSFYNPSSLFYNPQLWITLVSRFLGELRFLGFKIIFFIQAWSTNMWFLARSRKIFKNCKNLRQAYW